MTAIIRAVKDIGLETCGTFGLLQDGMAEELKMQDWIITITI